jgi:hypothetical protein
VPEQAIDDPENAAMALHELDNAVIRGLRCIRDIRMKISLFPKSRDNSGLATIDTHRKLSSQSINE